VVVLLIVAGAMGRSSEVSGGDEPQPVIACVVIDPFFAREVWPKVAERVCINCHNPEGDAAQTRFVLAQPEGPGARDAMDHNVRAFAAMARARASGSSRLLLKAAGGLDHGGGPALKPTSTAYRILERFVRRANGEPTASSAVADASEPVAPPFFEGVTMLAPRRLLRRVTLSLAGRLPTDRETAAVDRDGLGAMDAILDAIFREEAFFTRLKEGFNDIFLTLGIEDNAETLLSYDHFEHTRNWIEKYDLDHIPEPERQRARWRLADVYRAALLREPLELIAHIVRNDRPFTELATADYIMVSPYTARGYGIFEEVRPQFADPDDPFEYIPAKLKALKNRAEEIQESRSGMYPHAGFLAMFHYLHRYPTTETNRNRLRARMVYQHLLGIDVMQLAPRVTDAAAVAARYKNPTMEAPDCVVCHKMIDPVAGLFQDFNAEGHLGPRKGGWYQDMFPSGFESETMPASERWRAPQWLGERVARDPRFATAMVEHVYYIMMGRRVLSPPEDIDDPLFAARRRAYRAQRELIERAAAKLKASNFNLKAAFKAIVLSDCYRADGLAAPRPSGRRMTELDDVGIVRLLSPEQLNRKIGAIFGRPWRGLNDDMKILYGGIDSQTVTERNLDPGGAMGAIQRLMANDVACDHVARDFRLEPSRRRLFPRIEPSIVPGTDEANRRICEAMVDLHRRILGQERSADDPEVRRTFDLFAGIIGEARSRKDVEPRETYFCGGREEFRVDDPNYTYRAWRAVVTYLLRQHEFLYE
jgi:hypothetical protein